MTVIGKVKELNECVQRAVIKVTIWNQNNIKVVRGTMMVGFLEMCVWGGGVTRVNRVLLITGATSDVGM